MRTDGDVEGGHRGDGAVLVSMGGLELVKWLTTRKNIATNSEAIASLQSELEWIIVE